MDNAHHNIMQPPNRGNGEFHFIQLMAEEVGKGYAPGSTFNKQHQLYVNRKFRSMFGPMYTDRFLRSRFKLIKKRYHEFSELLNHENIYWNRATNIVNGNEELLIKHLKGNRMNNGQFRGEQHYDLMCQIFESGVEFE